MEKIALEMSQCKKTTKVLPPVRQLPVSKLEMPRVHHPHLLSGLRCGRINAPTITHRLGRLRSGTGKPGRVRSPRGRRMAHDTGGAINGAVNLAFLSGGKVTGGGTMP